MTNTQNLIKDFYHIQSGDVRLISAEDAHTLGISEDFNACNDEVIVYATDEDNALTIASAWDKGELGYGNVYINHLGRAVGAVAAETE